MKHCTVQRVTLILVTRRISSSRPVDPSMNKRFSISKSDIFILGESFKVGGRMYSLGTVSSSYHHPLYS